MKKGNLLTDIKKIEPLLMDIPKHWDARGAIMEMKKNKYKQSKSNCKDYWTAILSRILSGKLIVMKKPN